MAKVACKLCGKKFHDTVDYDGFKTIATPRLYCCKICKIRHQDNKPALKPNLYRSCKWCKKRFDARKNYDGTQTNYALWYCSPECKKANYRFKENVRKRRYRAEKKPKKLSWRTPRPREHTSED